MLFCGYSEQVLLSGSAAQASYCSAFPCFGGWTLGCAGLIAVVQLSCSVAPRHVGSSKTRDPSYVYHIGRQILYH